ncbi:hypothetical protein Tco_1500419 [Tanacetum coccineum]
MVGRQRRCGWSGEVMERVRESGSGGERRVRESGSGDRVHRVVGSNFGLRRKSPPEKFSGGGEWWPAIYGLGLLILWAYASSMPLIISFPLSMECDDSDGRTCMLILPFLDALLMLPCISLRLLWHGYVVSSLMDTAYWSSE